MKLFRDQESGEVFAFKADGSQDFLITDTMRPLTAEEEAAHLNPLPTAEELQVRGNTEARQYLLYTDWYVIRMQETGEPIPVEVSEARAAARQRIVTLLD